MATVNGASEESRMAEGGVEEKEVRPACVVREKNQWNWKVVTAEE